MKIALGNFPTRTHVAFAVGLSIGVIGCAGVSIAIAGALAAGALLFTYGGRTFSRTLKTPPPLDLAVIATAASISEASGVRS